jgi:hypothetical protein
MADNLSRDQRFDFAAHRESAVDLDSRKGVLIYGRIEQMNSRLRNRFVSPKIHILHRDKCR